MVAHYFTINADRSRSWYRTLDIRRNDEEIIGDDQRSDVPAIGNADFQRAGTNLLNGRPPGRPSAPQTGYSRGHSSGHRGAHGELAGRPLGHLYDRQIWNRRADRH